MRRIALLFTVGVLLLSGCASAPEAERMTWGYAEPGGREGPKLAFGVDGTDDLAVMFICDPSTGDVKFDLPVGEGKDVSAVRLRSGGVERRYEALVPGEPDGYELAYFRTNRADPVLRAFAKSGRLSVDVYGAFVAHPAVTKAEHGAIATFAKACRLD